MSLPSDPKQAHELLRTQGMEAIQHLAQRVEQYLSRTPSNPHWAHVGDIQRLNTQVQQMHALMDLLDS